MRERFVEGIRSRVAEICSSAKRTVALAYASSENDKGVLVQDVV